MVVEDGRRPAASIAWRCSPADRLGRKVSIDPLVVKCVLVRMHAYAAARRMADQPDVHAHAPPRYGRAHAGKGGQTS